MEHPPEHHVERVVEVLDGHRVERTDPDDAGVVDEDLDVPERARHLVHEFRDRRAVGHVAGERADAVALLAERGVRPLELADVAGANGDAASRARELPCDQEPEAA